jgi:hypothetical protein
MRSSGAFSKLRDLGANGRRVEHRHFARSDLGGPRELGRERGNAIDSICARRCDLQRDVARAGLRRRVHRGGV